MSFFSEEVESRCRISRTDLRREEVKEEEQKKRTTRRRRNSVRSHIGSDTSNPEATLQILPSCWTSCSLHNRIRMNRPSPALVLLFSIFLVHYASLFILFSRFSSSFLLLPFFSSVPFLSSHSPPFSLFRLQIYPTTPSRLPPFEGCSSRTTDTSRFFLPVVAEMLRHRPRTKPPFLPSFGQSRFHHPSLNLADVNPPLMLLSAIFSLPRTFLPVVQVP